MPSVRDRDRDGMTILLVGDLDFGTNLLAACATLAMEIVIALIVGFAAGYGVREWVSRRRREAEWAPETLSPEACL
jgi:hypothetical protein